MRHEDVEKQWSLRAEHWDRLRLLLNLRTDADVYRAAARLQSPIFMFLYSKEKRRRAPDPKHTARRLRTIKRLADELRQRLSEEPLAVHLAYDLDHQKFNEAPKRLARLTCDLAVVSNSALRIADKDENIRILSHLPPPRQGQMRTETAMLWPMLFRVWVGFGRKVTFSPDGPLVKFIALVHSWNRSAEHRHTQECGSALEGG
jgi:hypothetical protein